MAWTRVVLAALPTMIADIVRETLAPHPELQIVATLDSRHALDRVLAATAAQVAIVGLTNGESPETFVDLLRAHPDVTVLAISLEGQAAYRCTMRMLVSVTTQLSLQQFLDALRSREGVDRELHLISFQWPIVDAAPPADS